MRRSVFPIVALAGVALLVAVGRAPAESPDRVKQLQADQLAIAKRCYEAARQRVNTGTGDRADVFRWARIVSEAEVALGKKTALQAAQDDVARAKQLVEEAAKMRNMGVISEADHLEATYHRLQAEIALERVKAK